MKYRDFRSDTVTQPTEDMRIAMLNAEVGDDILGEDPTVQKLEAMAAEMFGKEAGLFTISGTMSNQVAIMAMTKLGDEILVGEDSHIYNLECGGLAALSGVQARPLRTEKGRFSLTELRQAIRPRGIQSAITRVLCLENTYNLNRGLPLTADYISGVAKIAHENEMQVYLDGARVFNAAAALSTDLKDLCQDIDALMFCLSKGLAAPVGSVLVGSQAFIDKARWIRQRIGGGMRQAGHMASAGIVALEQMIARLPEDHNNAKRLATGLATIDPHLVDVEGTQTNIVQVDFAAVGKNSGFMVDALLKRGIKVKDIGPTQCRMVTHWGLTAEDVDEVVEAVKEILG